MDIKNLHVVYNNGSGLSAATTLIQSSGEVHPSVNSNHVNDAVRKHSTGSEINWPRVLRELKLQPGPGQ